jgi:uncharacterized protein
MLTRKTFTERFSSRPVFGMIHLRPLPGSPEFVSLGDVVEAAVADARAIGGGGCDGFLIENFGDRPFTRGRVSAATVASMARVVTTIVQEVRMPFGINVLRNDALSALALAAATGASFIRVNVHTGAMVTDQGVIEGDAYATLRERAALCPDVLIFADHMVKHATPLGDIDPLQSAKDLRLRGMADVLIVSGVETGAAPDPLQLAALRGVIDAPVILGSGLTAETATIFPDADGAIVGTAAKRDGRVDAPVDAARVAAIVSAFKLG